jgi:PST family polysaccharide transporter
MIANKILGNHWLFYMGTNISTFRKIVVDNITLVCQYSVSGLVPILLIPYLVKQMGLDKFGTLTIALSWASYGALLVQYAFQLTGPKRLMDKKNGETEKDVLYIIGLAKLILLLSFYFCIALVLIICFFRGAHVNFIQVFLLVIIPFSWSINAFWYLQAKGKFAIASMLSVVGALVSLTSGFLGVTSNSPLILAAITLSISSVITGVGSAIVSVVSVSKMSRGKISWKVSLNELKDSWHLFSSQIISALYTAMGPIILGFLSGVEQAGAYSAVERVFNAIITACLLTHTASYPHLVKYFNQDKTKYAYLVKTVVMIYVGLALSIIVTSIIFWDHLVAFVLGNNGAVYSPLILAALFLLLLSVFGTVLTGYLTASSQMKRVRSLNIKVLAISFTLGIPGVLYFGAWAWLAALCCGQVFIVNEAVKVWKTELKGFKIKNPTIIK